MELAERYADKYPQAVEEKIRKATSERVKDTAGALIQLRREARSHLVRARVSDKTKTRMRRMPDGKEVQEWYLGRKATKNHKTAQQFPPLKPTIRERLKEISSDGAGCTTKELAQWYANEYPKAVEEKIRKDEKIKNKDDAIKKWRHQANSLKRGKDSGKIKERKRDGETAQELYYDSTATKNPTKRDSSVKTGGKEAALYLILKKYLESVGITAMYINDKRGKKGSNRFLYPDMVGFQDRTDNWTDEIRALAQRSPYHQAYLLSYEVKLAINSISTARDNAFQTLANSSWAHISYLVTEKINDKRREKIIEELRIIFSINGTGLIQLNKYKPDKSKILIEATPRTDINWNLSNRLAKNHTHFADFMKSIANFYTTGTIVLPEP